MSDKEKTLEVVGEVYAHISNGGVTFAIHDCGEYGPAIVIKASNFGNNVQTQELMVNQKVLEDLADLFNKAVRHEFVGEYCHAAKVFDASTCGSGGSSDEPVNSNYEEQHDDDKHGLFADIEWVDPDTRHLVEPPPDELPPEEPHVP